MISYVTLSIYWIYLLHEMMHKLSLTFTPRRHLNGRLLHGMINIVQCRCVKCFTFWNYMHITIGACIYDINICILPGIILFWFRLGKTISFFGIHRYICYLFYTPFQFLGGNVSHAPPHWLRLWLQEVICFLC